MVVWQKKIDSLVNALFQHQRYNNYWLQSGKHWHPTLFEGRVSIVNTVSYVSETLNILIIQFSSWYFVLQTLVYLADFPNYKGRLRSFISIIDIDMHGLVLALNNFWGSREHGVCELWGWRERGVCELWGWRDIMGVWMNWGLRDSMGYKWIVRLIFVMDV